MRKQSEFFQGLYDTEVIPDHLQRLYDNHRQRTDVCYQNEDGLPQFRTEYWDSTFVDVWYLLGINFLSEDVLPEGEDLTFEWDLQ